MKRGRSWEASKRRGKQQRTSCCCRDGGVWVWREGVAWFVLFAKCVCALTWTKARKLKMGTQAPRFSHISLHKPPHPTSYRHDGSDAKDQEDKDKGV